MADDSFQLELSQKLHDFAADVEHNSLNAMKLSVTNLRVTFGALLGMLKKKGLLADDPYQYSEKISELKQIATEPFLESQRLTVVSVRMHSFESQLAFFSDTFQFSLDNMTLSRLRAITQLLRFVRWESLTETSGETNTKIVAEIIGRVRKGEDSVSAGLANDMISQMVSHIAKIFELLKRVTICKREEYKLLLRTTFWSDLNLSAEEVSGNAENVQRKIKKEFAAHLKGQPYVQELIKELLDEDFAPNAAALREEVLHKLTVTKVVQTKPKITIDPKVELMEAVRTLATCNLPADIGLRKLAENASLLDVAQDSLGERFQKWIQKLMGMKSKPRVFVIDLFDPGTGTTKRDVLDFEAFMVEATGRVRVLTGVSNRNGPQFQALLQRSEDEILAWFERQFIDMAKFVEKVNGLDLYFKTEVPKDRRTAVKGVKTEVSQIRTTMGNANKMRHEAVGRKEEQEQLRRLGVKS